MLVNVNPGDQNSLQLNVGIAANSISQLRELEKSQ